VKECSGGEI